MDEEGKMDMEPQPFIESPYTKKDIADILENVEELVIQNQNQVAQNEQDAYSELTDSDVAEDDVETIDEDDWKQRALGYIGHVLQISHVDFYNGKLEGNGLLDASHPLSVLGLGFISGDGIRQTMKYAAPYVEKEFFQAVSNDDAAVDAFHALRITLCIAYDYHIPLHPDSIDSDILRFMDKCSVDGKFSLRLAKFTGVAVQPDVSTKLDFVVSKQIMKLLSVAYGEIEQISIFEESLYPRVEDGVEVSGSETTRILANLDYKLSASTSMATRLSEVGPLYTMKSVRVEHKTGEKGRPMEPSVIMKYDEVDSFNKVKLAVKVRTGMNVIDTVYTDDDHIAASRAPLVREVQFIDVFASAGFGHINISPFRTQPHGPVVQALLAGCSAKRVDSAVISDLAERIFSELTSIA